MDGYHGWGMTWAILCILRDLAGVDIVENDEERWA